MSTTDDLLRQLIEERERAQAAKAAPRAEAKAETRPTGDADLRMAYPLAAFIIGLVLWPLGARYTIDGLAWIAATTLSALRIPASIPVPLRWEWYLILVWIPYVCSRVEWRPPLKRQAGRWKFAAPDLLLIWLVVAGLDVSTTFFGLRVADPDAWPVAREVANNVVWALLVAIFLSGAPEWLLRQGWRRLRG